jgi:hypothetical protein
MPRKYTKKSSYWKKFDKQSNLLKSALTQFQLEHLITFPKLHTAEMVLLEIYHKPQQIQELIDLRFLHQLIVTVKLGVVCCLLKFLLTA